MPPDPYTPGGRISRESGLALVDEAERWERAYRRLADGLHELADLPEPLNNKESARAQCAYLKQRAREILDG